MTVVNPKSISGINSITMASGSDDLLTIHSNNTTERVRVNNSGDVIVGSGVTLSPDGDVFATGVCTATSFSGDGSSLTGIAATDNVRTGILDVAGIATFRDEVQIITDNKRLKFGAGNDLNLYSTGTNGWVFTPQSGADLYMGTNAGEIYLQTGASGNDTALKVVSDEGVELYYNNLRKFRTVSDGVEVNAGEGADAVLALIADEGDDNADYWRFLGGTAGQLDIASYSSGSWVNHLSIKPDGEVTKPNNPAASVYTNTNEQGGHSNKVTAGYIKNGGETFDNSNDHSYVSNIGRFTCPVAGRYRVSFYSNLNVGAATGSAIYVESRKNGGTVHLHYDTRRSVEWQYMAFSDLIQCAANDYLEIYIKSGNGSNQGTIGVDGSSSQWNSTFYELVA